MTKKTRVHELARELNVDWKVLKDRGKVLGIEIATHQATISSDEESKLRAAMSGSTVKGPVSKATAATAAPASATPASGRVVIRRRKADVEEPQAAQAIVETTPVPSIAAASVEVQAAAPVVVAAVEEPVVKPAVSPVIAPPTFAVSSEAIESKKADVEAPDKVVMRESISEATPVVVTPVVSPLSTTTTAVATATITAPTTSPTSRASATSTTEEVPLKRPSPMAGGATIVRRASPEEIEAQKQAAAAREASLQANRTSRKEDNRGVRVSGMGLLSRNRPQSSGGGVGGSSSGDFSTASAAPGFVPDVSIADEWNTRRSKAPTREEELEEERKTNLKIAKQKRANSGVSMRALLEQFDDGDIEADEPAAEEAPSRVFTPSTHAKRKDPRRRRDNKKTQITTPRARYRVVEVEGTITVGELSHQLSVKSGDVIKKLMTMGVMATINQEIDLDTATLISQEYGFEVQNKEVSVEDVLVKSGATSDSSSVQRSPIVTIMGHVDHGKTSLLDAIRSANVASGEAGGITQHIGAYTVDFNDQSIAFLDTPGHEAFSSMRARGASLTDIVVLVVAADDGVMPQTVEAINHAKAANVPIIVAVNKIDKASTQLDRLYAQLAEHGIQSEEWGGENQFVKTSALQRIGINELLDAILLQAEVLDLKSAAIGFAKGAVVEAHLDKGRGPVATIMVQSGLLEVGQYLVAGTEFGRVRAMIDHRGKKLTQAGPSTPVEVVGLSGVPQAGDAINAVEDEKTCRDIVALRQEQERRKHSGKSSAASLADLLAKVQTNERPEVAVIVKADVQGSLEAVCEAVAKLTSAKVSNRIVHRAVGGITESDLTLASATGAVLLGFNVRASRGLDDLAERSGVVIQYFSIIYELVDAMKAIMAGKLPPIVTEQVLGHAEVRQTINVPKIGTVAGSAVIDGKITRQSHLRLVRDSVVIYTGRISSLRRFKDDVREVAQGYECGISIDGYQDVRIGDVIEAYVLEETAPTL